MGAEADGLLAPAGLLACWPAGLLACWPAGMLACCPAGLLPCWPAALLPCWLMAAGLSPLMADIMRASTAPLLASAPSPLGPWKMYEGNPILFQTEDWEGSNVAMGSVVKRGIGGDSVVPPLPEAAADAESSLGGSAQFPPASHCPPDCGSGHGPHEPDPVTNSTFFMWYCTGSESVVNSSKFPGQAWSGGDNTGLGARKPASLFKLPFSRLSQACLGKSSLSQFRGKLNRKRRAFRRSHRTPPIRAVDEVSIPRRSYRRPRHESDR